MELLEINEQEQRKISKKRISDGELSALKNLIKSLPDDQIKEILNVIPVRDMCDFLADTMENATKKLYEINKLIETHM